MEDKKIGKAEELDKLEKDMLQYKEDPENKEWYKQVRAMGWELAAHITMSAPDNEEKRIAIMKIREAVFWANAAIAKGEVNT